ncbi:hypothetical protein HPB51_016881 [Rhipicephalus microplus]|uniref:Uncharacterized protein n=1 Tax=Rhipicephalus microplus TaxID=6941 RepID=A0A9J6DAQ8_RHIMP|nr:hypothetical protein HPB51_016881 [Rhipicephalus microplus]
MVGREAGTMCSVPREDDRRLVFDPRWRRSCSASMGSKLDESSRRSFVFIQALYEKGNARTVERTTKETLFEGFSVFGAAGGASKASTRPVFEERPGAVGVTMKKLHQRVDRYRSVGLICAVVADYLEVLHGLIRRLLSSIGLSVFARDSSAEGVFSLNSHGTFTGNVVRLLDNWCLLFNPMDKTEYCYFLRQLFFRSLVASKQDHNFMFVKALDEIKGNAYAIERTTKEILTTLLNGFYFSGAAGGAIKAPTMPVLQKRPGVVCVMMKELHQWIDRFPSMGQACAFAGDYLEVHQGVVRCLLSSIGSVVFAGNVSAGGLFSPERHMTCIGYGVRFADNRCTMPETETDYFYGQLGYRSLKANRDQSFMIIKTLQLLLVQKHAGITVLEQAFELLEHDLFAQLDKLLDQFSGSEEETQPYPELQGGSAEEATLSLELHGSSARKAAVAKERQFVGTALDLARRAPELGKCLWHNNLFLIALADTDYRTNGESRRTIAVK